MSGYWGEFASLMAINLLALISPGADFAVIVRQSVRFGARIGSFTALGIGLGLSVHLVYTILGFGTLLQKFPWLLDVVRIAGGSYLIFLGYRFLRSAPRGDADITTERLVTQTPPTAIQALRMGFFTNATNPKAMLFFLAVFTSVVKHTTPLGVQAFYGVCIMSIAVVWFVFVSHVFGQRRVRQAFLRLGHWFDRVMGVALIAVAVRLLIGD